MLFHSFIFDYCIFTMLASKLFDVVCDGVQHVGRPHPTRWTQPSNALDTRTYMAYRSKSVSS